MKTKSILTTWPTFLFAAAVYAALFEFSALAQFQWSESIASTANVPESELNIGLALDTDANCYVTGWFDGTNNFGGTTLTNQSTGGSDIFLAKYNAAGTLQWAQRAGGTSANYGRAVGADTNGNIYVTGGYRGPATFGSINLSATSGEQFFIAKYSSNGLVQWVTNSTGGNGNNYGIGLTVDGAGNTYALAVMDWSGTSITFGSKTASAIKGGTTFLVLVKYDSTGTAQWTQLFDSSVETYGSKVAVDAAGNVYVRGTFYTDMTIGTSNLVVSAGSANNMFIAKFNSTGNLIWVQAPSSSGGNTGEGGVAVDPAGNVFVSGAFNTNLNFGGGIILTNMANSSARLGDAFLAKYNSAGVIQWAQAAGDAVGGFYWDVVLDAQTNIYAAGGLVSGAAVSKYSAAGTFQWTYAANGPPAIPVGSVAVKCAVDAFGHCYLDGIYQGTTTFATNALQPQETWNLFLAETTTNPTVQFTATPSSGLPPLTVQFNSTNVDNQGNTIASWNWSFGDGTITNVQNPSHTYTNAGTFNPSFVATNNHNSTVIGYGLQITVLMPTPATNFTFITNNGAITITSYTGTNPIVIVPATISALAVTAIGSSAFGNSSVTSVTIPNGVASIGFGVFQGCQQLTNLVISATVTNIGGWAFNQCYRLPAINLDPQNPVYQTVDGVLFNRNQTILVAYPAGRAGTSYAVPFGVTNIWDSAFVNCALSSVTVPSGVTSISSDAFAFCMGLTSFTIGTNVASIGSAAFLGCSSLTNITIPASVVQIGNTAFSGCSVLAAISVDPANTAYASIDDVLFTRDLTTLVQYPDGKTGTAYTIPNSTTNIVQDAFSQSRLTTLTISSGLITIGEYAFNAMTFLTNVIIPTTVVNIKPAAFYQCWALVGINIPNSVTNIGSGAFGDCRDLTNITVDAFNPNYTSVAGVLFNKNITMLLECPGGMGGDYSIPTGVTSIGDDAFVDCYNLTNVTFGATVRSIGGNAFFQCISLTSITIPDSVTNIGSYAFAYCSSLTTASFEGNAPVVSGLTGSADTTVFQSETGTAYYTPGTSGWDQTFGGWLTARWYQPQPKILGSGYGLGATTNGFGFTISWATNLSVVVQATTNLSNPLWTPLATNPLVSGTNYFSDPNWTNYSRRFYRVTTP